MKKILVMMLIFIFLSSVIANAEIYPTVFKVNEIDEYNDILYLMDFHGNFWLAIGIEDYEINDIIAAIMDNNNTEDTIYDDMIISMCYCGYIDG